MYSVVMLSVLAATGGGHGCPAGGCRNVAAACGVIWGPQGFLECLGHRPPFNYGGVAPHLFAGTPSAKIPDEEVKAWNNYLDELDPDDRAAMKEVWQVSDYEARRKLLGMLFQLRADQLKKEKDAAPLTEKEAAAWQAHLKTLKGDDLKKAEADWAKADFAGRRKLLDAIKKP